MSLHNLYAVLGRVRPNEALDWAKSYRRYNYLLQWIADKYKVSLSTTCGVFSALSPNNDYLGNLRDCIKVIEHVIRYPQEMMTFDTGFIETVDTEINVDEKYLTVSTYGNNKRKALAIARGAEPLGLIQARKTRNFYFNLLNPSDDYRVTVDGHMYWAWIGRKGRVQGGEDGGARVTPKLYEGIAQDIRDMAAHHSLVPCEMQAILWHAWRKMHGVVEGQLSFFPDDVYVVKGLLEVELTGAGR